jgi:hypothetical protein
MKVEVTEEDIAKGQRGCRVTCPIACAIWREHLLTCLSVQVLRRCVFIRSKEEETHGRFWLPDEACVLIESFDLGKKVKPITFEMEKF